MSETETLKTEVICVIKRTYFAVIEGVPVAINERKAYEIVKDNEIDEIGERAFKLKTKSKK
jgi:hypothetical protein